MMNGTGVGSTTDRRWTEGAMVLPREDLPPAAPSRGPMTASEMGRNPPRILAPATAPMLPPRAGLLVIGRAGELRARYLEKLAYALAYGFLETEGRLYWLDEEERRFGGAAWRYWPFGADGFDAFIRQRGLAQRIPTHAGAGGARGGVDEEHDDGHGDERRRETESPSFRIVHRGVETEIRAFDLPTDVGVAPFGRVRREEMRDALRGACARAAGVILVYERPPAERWARVGNLERATLQLAALWTRLAPEGRPVPIALVELSDGAECAGSGADARDHEADGRGVDASCKRFDCAIPSPACARIAKVLRWRWQAMLRPVQYCVQRMVAQRRREEEAARAAREADGAVAEPGAGAELPAGWRLVE